MRHPMRLRAALLALALALAPGLAAAQPSTEMVAGNGNTNDTSTLTPTLTPPAVTLLNNSNNPGGTTFASIAAPTPTATLTIPATSLQYANGTNFQTNGVYVGGVLWGSPRFAPMDDIAVGTNGMFTSLPVVAGGTGIAIGTNRAWFLEARTDGLRAANAPQIGQRLRIADAVINLSVPMSNVALHIVGIGSSISGKEFSVEMDFLPADSIGATGIAPQPLSGTANLTVSGNQISNTATTHGTSCSAAAAACGSVHVTGTAITRIALRLYIRSSDPGEWPSGGFDGFMIGLSGEVADLQPALVTGTIPTSMQPGETYYGLTLSCTNSGPNTARGSFCEPQVSAGTVSDLTCTGLTAGAVAPNTAATCTHSYTAPFSGSGVGSVSFTGTTGAWNDRIGGTSKTATNNFTTTAVSRTLAADLPYVPSQPSGICSAMANKLTFAFAPVTGGTEAASYDLVSRSPFSFDTSGKPVVLAAASSFQTETVATTPSTPSTLFTFKPQELTTLPLGNGTGEIVIITSRIVGRPGSAMTVQVQGLASSDPADEHDVFTIENASGTMLARSPSPGSDATDGPLSLSFTMPSQGYVFLRQYVADYGGSYGPRLDGGCLRTNLVTRKTVAATAEAGQAVTFTITVQNTGPSAASNVQLTDVMPSSLTGVTATPSAGTYNAATGLWTLGSLAANMSATLTLTGTPRPAASGTTVANTTTTAAGDQIDPTTAADVLSASVAVLQAARVDATKAVTLLSNGSADCAGRSSTPDPGVEAFTPGSCVEYLIRLTNPTSALARDIRMTDVLAVGLDFMAASVTGFDTGDPGYGLTAPATETVCGGAACTVLLDKARLAAGATGEVRIRAVLR